MDEQKHSLPYIVYPGHSLIIALYAMWAFPSAKEALAPTEYGWCEMAGSLGIPGSGDSVHATARLLHEIFDRKLTIGEALEVADAQWSSCCGPGTGNHEDKYEEGREQARQHRDLFIETAKTWNWSQE